MNCWKCSSPLEELPKKIGFRELCPLCGAALHCCASCRFYAPGKPNDCAVPGTEYVRDREGVNFCEDFAVGSGKKGLSRDEVLEKARRLFGEEG